jgi:hypothetical protein
VIGKKVFAPGNSNPSDIKQNWNVTELTAPLGDMVGTTARYKVRFHECESFHPFD